MLRAGLPRRGITLIEMMVAMALSLGIMLILTESFKMALDFVRGANSTGELIYQLNGAGTILVRDLQTEHFLPEDNKPNRGVKLSDQRLDLLGTLGWTPPKAGFFKVVAPDPGVELSDAYGFKISKPATNHLLHFTSILPGGTEQNGFTLLSSVGVGTPTNYTSRAAEIAYFLEPTGWTTPNPSDPKRQPRHNLIRRSRLVTMDSDQKNLLSAVGDVAGISVNSSGMANTLASLTNPLNRLLPPPMPYPLGLASAPVGDPRYGEDIVLSNVLSFEIKADWTPNSSLVGSVLGPTSLLNGNTDAPFDSLFQGGGVFDTGSPSQFIRIKSLQIVIRVYDPRTKQTRQNTWKIAM